MHVLAHGRLHFGAVQPEGLRRGAEAVDAGKVERAENRLPPTEAEPQVMVVPYSVGESGLQLRVKNSAAWRYCS